MIISVTHQKDQGKVRERQEDSCFSFFDEQKAVLILSDGMGGHAGGDLASQASVGAAIDALAEWPNPGEEKQDESNGRVAVFKDNGLHPEENGGGLLLENALDIDTVDVNGLPHPGALMTAEEWIKSEPVNKEATVSENTAGNSAAALLAAEIPQRMAVVGVLENTYSQAQKAVSNIALDVSYGLGSAGCTLTVALITNGWLHVGHIGDSRAYLYRQGQLEQITLDHSGSTLLLNAGLITPEEARHHPESHSLYRFLGINAVELIVDVHHEKLEEGDVVLLCSDGLWGMLPDDHIVEILRQNNSVEEAATALLDQANSAGGEDNISVAIAKI